MIIIRHADGAAGEEFLTLHMISIFNVSRKFIDADVSENL
jgi:hypothetical protein